MIKIFDKLYKKYRDKRAIKQGYQSHEDKERVEKLLDMDLPLDMVYSALCTIEKEEYGVKYSYVDTQFFLLQEDVNKPGRFCGEAIQLTGGHIGDQVHFCKSDMSPNSLYNLFGSVVDFKAKVGDKYHIYSKTSQKYGTGEWILSVYSEQKNKPHHFLAEFEGKEVVKLSKLVDFAERYNSTVAKNNFEKALEKQEKIAEIRSVRKQVNNARSNVKEIFEKEK